MGLNTYYCLKIVKIDIQNVFLSLICQNLIMQAFLLSLSSLNCHLQLSWNCLSVFKSVVKGFTNVFSYCLQTAIVLVSLNIVFKLSYFFKTVKIDVVTGSLLSWSSFTVLKLQLPSFLIVLRLSKLMFRTFSFRWFVKIW